MNARIGGLLDVPSLDILEQHAVEPAIADGKDMRAHAMFYADIPDRAHKDAYVNDRGKELCQLLRDTGLVVINGELEMMLALVHILSSRRCLPAQGKVEQAQ